MTDMENRIASVTNRLLQRVTLASKLWLSMITVIFMGLIIVSTAFKADQRQLTEQQLTILGTAISQQTASSSAALILAGDTLSLSINLQQLAALIQISGAEVVDRKGNRLAQAGQASELFIEHPILSEQTPLGTVRIHLNPEVDTYRLALPLTLIVAALTLLLLLITTLLQARHFSRPLQALLCATEQLCADHLITPLDSQRHDEFGQIAQRLNQHFGKPVPEPDTELTEPTPTDPEIDINYTANITPANTELDTPIITPIITPIADSLIDTRPITAESITPSPQNSEATATLSSNGPTEIIPASTPITTSDAISNSISNTTSNTTSNTIKTPPLQAVASSPEEQSYLFYINHHVGGSDTLTASERELLLVRYRKALEQVARLYKGGMNEDALGNWYVRFLPLSNDQSHGINALCAAQLFNALYRGINAQAIRNFSPALNMKLVLLCGPSNTADTLAEDALLLSDQIQDNDLITHKALYQIHTLQERLLSNAQYRKFNPDTYLISALNADYQTLIDRQAEYFLKRTQDQEKSCVKPKAK